MLLCFISSCNNSSSSHLKKEVVPQMIIDTNYYVEYIYDKYEPKRLSSTSIKVTRFKDYLSSVDWGTKELDSLYRTICKSSIYTNYHLKKGETIYITGLRTYPHIMDSIFVNYTDVHLHGLCLLDTIPYEVKNIDSLLISAPIQLNTYLKCNLNRLRLSSFRDTLDFIQHSKIDTIYFHDLNKVSYLDLKTTEVDHLYIGNIAGLDTVSLLRNPLVHNIYVYEKYRYKYGWHYRKMK